MCTGIVALEVFLSSGDRVPERRVTVVFHPSRSRSYAAKKRQSSSRNRHNYGPEGATDHIAKGFVLDELGGLRDDFHVI